MTASFLALVQFVTFDEKFGLSPLMLLKMFVITGPERKGGGGGGVTANYMAYIPKVLPLESESK